MHWLLLLAEPEGHETTSSDFSNLESDSWNITDGVTRSTKTSDQDFIVLVDQRHSTVLRNVSGDSLVVFLKLDSHALSDGGVGLLSFDCDLFNDDAGSMGGLLEWFSPHGNIVSLSVMFIGPATILE